MRRIGMAEEKCVVCGRMYEPIPLEAPNFKIWGIEIKPIHKLICPLCIFKGLIEISKLGINAYEIYIKSQEKKK